MGSIPTLVKVFLCPCVGPFPSVRLTLTWLIWLYKRNLSSLKKQLGVTFKVVDDTKESLEFTQKEHSDLAEHVTACETEQSAQWNEITHQSIYNWRWNLIFYCVMESPEQNCAALVKNVLIQQLHLLAEIVHSMKFCGAHRLGKQNANKTRPLIVHFTCRSDRELVWKNRFRPKDSPVAIGEDFPKHIQHIRRKVLIPALQKIKKENPRAKASVIGSRLIFNRKRYFHYNIPKEWLPAIIPTVNGPRVNTQTQEDNGHVEA